ncbi:MAG: phospholipid carrier-dependent glycosyltransferase [Acidobacteria bacterium]|nr:phospholipid carrier-dependent glycosyltransferase [Acidobacteriota bacterium]
MQGSRLAKRGWVLLLAAAALVYCYGLGRAPFVGADEPRYAQVAREMYERGDAVTPTLGGFTWFEKPALVYWAAAAGYGLFGVSEWAARLGSVSAGWLTVLLVGWAAGRVEARAGAESAGLRLAAGGVAASSAGLIVFSRAVNFDIYITAAVTLSLACLLAAEFEEGGRRRLLLAGFWAGLGAGLLAKGLVGVVVPAGVVALYSLLGRRWPAPLLKSAAWGVPLALVVAASWYGPVLRLHGWTFFDEFFVQHHFARYVSNKYRHPQPFFFYLLILPLLALPWPAFLASSLAGARRWAGRGGAGAGDRARLFALVWLAVPVAFFSLSGSKLPGYILPALPGAALLAGDALARYARGEGGERAMHATAALLLLFAAGVIVYAARTGDLAIPCALLVASPAAAAGACALFQTVGRAVRATLVAGACLLTVMLAVSCALDGGARRESVRDLLRAANGRGYGSARVLNLHTVERTAEFYAAGRIDYDTQGEPSKLEGANQVEDLVRARGGPALVFVPVEHDWQIEQYPPLESERLGDNGAVAVYAVRAR